MCLQLTSTASQVQEARRGLSGGADCRQGADRAVPAVAGRGPGQHGHHRAEWHVPVDG